MPSLSDLRNKVKFDLYSCPEFSIDGALFPGNRLHIHLDWPGKKLTPSLYKKGLLAISTIKHAAAAQGIPAIYVLVPRKLLHWESMFGFEVIEEWTNRLDPTENLFLMKQATS
jgi:hypothetical protein